MKHIPIVKGLIFYIKSSVIRNFNLIPVKEQSDALTVYKCFGHVDRFLLEFTRHL